MSERDYVLGTHDAEIERLGLQHAVWRPWTSMAWQRAGVTSGSRVVDVGCGPGFATADLADIVGNDGAVLGVERSTRFVAAARAYCAARGLTNVRIEERDLMLDEIPARELDVAWCRWVACFVSSPIKLIGAIAGGLRSGGVAIFHEYGNYASWRLMPPRAPLDRFVAAVMANWRASGGEPDIGLQVPALLKSAGFRIRSVQPLVFAVSPRDFAWQWPSAFVTSAAARLSEQEYLNPSDAELVQHAFDDAARNWSTLMLTPLVLEIVAEKL